MHGISYSDSRDTLFENMNRLEERWGERAMNVYDFDQTIYGGDSSIDFYFYCLGKNPKAFACLFRQAYGVFLHKAHRIGTTRMKEYFFLFLAAVEGVDGLVDSFWAHHFAKIQGWYLERKEGQDVIVSASPEFLLEPVCKRLAVSKPIATRMDRHTGRIDGKNCKGEEKARRFFEKYPHGVVSNFYSDSKSDAPLADIAEKAFLVKKGEVYPWQR